MNDKTVNCQISTAKYKVCVRCATFNHAPYITATLDGFCRQQTDFPFICVIIDDASQDGAQEVISRYLQEHFNEVTKEETENYNLTLACHKVNANCHFAVFLLKKNHYSQGKMPLDYANRWKEHCSYVALCEGDDYWTDPHKLQKQADALDANPQATLVYTNFQTVDGEGNPISRPFIKDFPSRSHSGDNLPTLLRYGNYIMVLTSMYRYKVFESEYFTNSPVRMDFNTTMAAALMGNFIWMPERTGCYRSLESGMVRSNLQKGLRWIQDIYRYYAGLVMNGQCKPLSLGQRIHLTTLILMRALKKKDHQLKKDVLRACPLSYLLLPVAFVKLKVEKMKS